jgi:hypothetical protein
MATRAKYDGKTSVWFYSTTKNTLSPFKTAGETWDTFMIRVMVELRKKNRKMDIVCKTTFVKTDKITTVWLNKTTVSELNGFRRTDENWGRFFERISLILKDRKMNTNPNDLPVK